MAESESALLRRFVGAGDTRAFAEIVRRYAGLVYGTCLRVLADADQAADATQETFFQLMKKGGEIRGSLAGWLHQVAVRKAVDLIRTEAARRQREERYADGKSGEDPAWHEVSPHVDEALNRLDDRTRELLIRHYLEGRSMTDLAMELDISRPTISRQIDSGLARLRAHLQRRGVLVTAAGLSALLSENAAHSAPAAVLGQLGKITLAGAGAASVTASTTSVPAVLSVGLFAAAKLKVMLVVAAVVVGAGLITYKGFSTKPPEAPLAPVEPAREDTVPRGGGMIRQSVQPAVPAAAPETPQRQPSEDVTPVVTEPTVPVAVPPETAVEQPVVPQVAPADRAEETRPDLSSPEATVRSFTKAIVSGDAESVMACMLPDGTDYKDMQEILYADPDDPRQRDEYQMRLWLQSFDPDAEMPIVSVEQTERGTAVTWQVTFKEDFTVEGHTFRAGDTYNLDATLRQAGDSWLIDGI